MEQTKERKDIKAKVQKLGSYLSSMVMPNIGAFIAWGVITALFIETGWAPNKELATLVDPMIKYLLPLLIGYTGGNMVHGQRGAVVGAIATMGVIVGADVPMFIGAMIMGPLGGWLVKKFDDVFQSKIKTGFEMLVNNFSSGLIGFVLAILGFYGIGPIVSALTHAMASGVETIINMHLLPLANVFIEPAKILFLNNAINHGILTPLGTEQAATTGKSILFLLETNPGPGLGVLLAFTLFGRGAAKASAPGAIIIQFLGGIHEIYFPYVMMKPMLFLAVIAGGVSGTFTFQALNAGLQAAASPGSIFAILAMTPKGSYIANIAGVVVAAAVSFLVAAIILKADKTEEDSLAASQEAMRQAKAESKGQASTTDTPEIGHIENINKIIFACDAGMGSSAMGASILRDKVKKAGLGIPVTNSAINNLVDDNNALVVTQVELYDRAKQRAPRSTFVTVENFMNSPRYDEIITRFTTTEEPVKAEAPLKQALKHEGDSLDDVKRIIFLYNDKKGSAHMGAHTLNELLAKHKKMIPVEVVASATYVSKDGDVVIYNQLDSVPQPKSSQVIVVDNFVETTEYDRIVQQLNK